MTTKYVIVEQINYGRSWRAKPGLSFTAEAEAEAWIVAKVGDKHRHRYHVESRKVKDLDASQAMHCQCCGRAIHAATGTIAHHGYQRPGHGWQTRSCFGAKRLPWEVDRSALQELIDHLKEILLRNEYARTAVFDEIEPVTRYYFGPYDRFTCRSPELTVEFTRETLAQVRRDTPGAFERLYGDDASFDALKGRDLDRRDFTIRQLKRDIGEFTARYNSWKQTHKWDGKLWAAI